MDLFDGAYPVQMAERGQALNWCFGNAASTRTPTSAAIPATSDAGGPMLINLWGAQYEADFTELP